MDHKISVAMRMQKPQLFPTNAIKWQENEEQKTKWNVGLPEPCNLSDSINKKHNSNIEIKTRIFNTTGIQEKKTKS